MPFGSKTFDKQLDWSQWWTDCHFVPGAPPPVTQKRRVWLLPVFVLFSLAAWLDPGEFYGNLHSAKYKTYKRFLLCFLPHCQSPPSHHVSGTVNQAFTLVNPSKCCPLIGCIMSGCLCPRFQRIVVDIWIWEFYFLTTLFRDFRGRRAGGIITYHGAFDQLVKTRET